MLLTALDVPTNLIAGGSRYSFRRFLAWDIAGRVTWLLIYGGLGYLFSSQWQTVTALLSSCGLWIGVAVGVILLLVQMVRRAGLCEQAVA